MRIIINTAHQRLGGGVQVALSFIHEFRNFKENEYHVFVGPGVRKSLNEKDFPSYFKFYNFNYGVINLRKTFRINKELKIYEKEIKPDCIISTSGPTYFHSEAPQIIGFNLPLYIFPESPYIKGLSVYRKTKLNIKKKIHVYYFKRDAKALVVQTEEVNNRVRRLFNNNEVYTVTNNASNYYKDYKIYPNKLPKNNKEEKRFLTITSYYKHKNLEIIPKILDILKYKGYGNIKFVLTLNKDDYKSYITNSSNITNVGQIKPEECPSLYNECDFMFQPTLAECFTASYPEAMIMEKPIITTELGFAKSICGDAAIYYKPMDAEDAAEKIIYLVKNKDKQESMIQKGKEQLLKYDSPIERAKKILNICNNIVTKNL